MTRAGTVILALALAGPADATPLRNWINPNPLSEPNHIVNERNKDVYILDTAGGLTYDFKAKFEEWRKAGYRAIITGKCWSACTLVLADPRACVTGEKAEFGFHQPRYYSPVTKEVTAVSEVGTQMMWSQYPANVKAKLGHLTNDMVYIKGTEILPLCGLPQVSVPYLPPKASFTLPKR